jgi:hypothetical protein
MREWWDSLGIVSRAKMNFLVFILIPSGLFFLLLWYTWATKSNNSVWIGFWGNIFSGIISGSLTLIGVLVTISFYRGQSKNKIRPYYNELKLQLKNLTDQLGHVLDLRKDDTSVEYQVKCANLSRDVFIEFISKIENSSETYEKRIPELNGFVQNLIGLIKGSIWLLKDEFTPEELDDMFFESIRVIRNMAINTSRDLTDLFDIYQ